MSENILIGALVSMFTYIFSYLYGRNRKININESATYKQNILSRQLKLKIKIIFKNRIKTPHIFKILLYFYIICRLRNSY